MSVTSSALIRAVRGPVILIAFGVLVAIDHSGNGLSFWRTWPLLIILYGFFTLVERLLPRSDAYVPPPVSPAPPAGRVS